VTGSLNAAIAQWLFGAGLAHELGASLKDVTGLEGAVEIVPLGALPDDGKLIVDERALA
jgi:phenylacetate-CoA ligase